MGPRNHLLHILIVGVLLAATCTAGCTSSSVSQDPFLKAYVDQIRFNSEHDSHANLTAWSEVWVNYSTVTVTYTVQYTLSNTTPYNTTSAFTVMHFTTVEEANQFVQNKSVGYTLESTNYSWSSNETANGIMSPYERAAGHPPSIFRHYDKRVVTDGNQTVYMIHQDAEVVELTEYSPPINQPRTIIISNTTRAITVPVMDIETSFNTLSDQNWTLLTPFTKTTNEYGNAVYIGVVKNKTGNYIHTESIELVKNETEAKDHFAKIVLSKTNEGYAAYDPSVYGISAKGKGVTAGRDVSAEWFGRATYSYFRVFYGYNSVYRFWWVMTVVQ